ncbi:MAG: maltose alpha-D-glucosyltransferase [Deltaproteobacteria bacterium]|nr:maltose alpha-D-glucosyltransferase [Deltaproteobacteria bacterium]
MQSEPLWYKDAVIYELRVRSFYDSNGDGIGDLRGVTSKLDYLADLGVTALWLLPFYASPLRDDGYDISSYVEVHPDCGTLADFRELLKQAHRRGLRVITELVLNHTSDQHPWFQRARRAPAGSIRRNYYLWSDDPHRFQDARVIFQDFETSNWAWDPLAKAYYWHRFYAHQPDLNFESPAVRREILRAVNFWLRMGVDGLRLDAVPYLFEQEGSSCENLPQTHAYLKELRAYVDSRYADRMLLAEANQWPEDAAAYFGQGDECHMAFHFPIMPRLYMALRMENSFPIRDILQLTPAIPPTCQWAIFLRNHDELTLEMVTDEERDYLVRTYARDRRDRINLGIRRRLGPLLQNNRKRIELMTALLLSLPGTPVLYYGDELGMGDNVYLGDRDGVRTPMQWTPDRNAGFSAANPQKLILPVITDAEYHYQAVNVETQHQNPSSLLWWMRRIVALRKQHQVFGRGVFEPLHPTNHRILAYLRKQDSRVVLVVANLSRFPQPVELDLSQYAGRQVRELFGRVKFPRITEGRYPLALAPHGFYWFDLAIDEAKTELTVAPDQTVIVVDLRGHGVAGLLQESVQEAFGDALLTYIRTRRWFRGRARQPLKATVLAAPRLDERPSSPALALVSISYPDGDPETYLLPLAIVPETHSDWGVICAIEPSSKQPFVLRQFVVDATDMPGLGESLLELLRRRTRTSDGGISILAAPERSARKMLAALEPSPSAHRIGGDQSNTTWVLGDKLVAKLMRKMEEGTSPEVELGRHLCQQAHFTHVPELVGRIDLMHPDSGTATAMVFHQYVPSQGDAWRLILDDLSRKLEESAAQSPAPNPAVSADATPLSLALGPAEGIDVTPLGSLAGRIALLGQRTAELHIALSSNLTDPALAPEPFTPFFQRALYQSLRNAAFQAVAGLEARMDDLAPSTRLPARTLVDLKDRTLEPFRPLLTTLMRAKRIRCHGDLHLGQVLWTGDDVVFIDFEGEPARTAADRKAKRSPLADVAGMIRSFEYAVEKAISGRSQGTSLRPSDVSALRPWGRRWALAASALFLRSYLETQRTAALVPADPEQLRTLLHIFAVEKSLYEITYELAHRPDWVELPVRGTLALLGVEWEPSGEEKAPAAAV